MRIAPFLLLVGCASSSSGSEIDGSLSGDGGGGSPIDAGPDAAHADACPDGEFAVSVGAGDELTCAAIDGATAEAVRSRCSIYAGWRDSCDGCADPPAKWSRSGPLDCDPGEGGGNTCVSTILDVPGSPVALATLDLDGDVNGDDKLYGSIHCVAAPRDPRPAPCAPGWAISGRAGDTWMCAPISEAAIAYVGACGVHLGWRDSCDGCTDPPAKWGRAGDAGCENGAGGDNTCTTAALDDETVNLFGLNTDGDVDGNDKLYLGLGCAEPEPGGTTVEDACPAGQFVVATNTDGTLTCADPAVGFAAYLRDRCALYLGWHDSCEACVEPPTKWGWVGTASCANGTGADDTCADATLGGATLPLFGLSTDGDVNGDDTLYLGFRCDPPATR
jgi:hypothetical protein